MTSMDNQPDMNQTESAQTVNANDSTYANDPNYARDPVCGMWVDKRTAKNTLAPPSNMQMETVYFCSPTCKAIFEEDPARYGSSF
jgi:YHS domain-containing protein